MKVLFVEARKKQNNLDAERIVKEFTGYNKFKNLSIIASLQYLDLIPIFRKEFGKNGIRVHSAKGVKTCYENQIIGCDVNAALKLAKKVDAFLVLSDGKFHVMQLALATSKPVFILQGDKINLISQREIDALNKKRKAAVLKFLNADNIGIIVSAKPGQCHLKQALELKKKIERKNKKAFLFFGDTINIQELENFSCQSWVNTACPAIILDSARIVNAEEISKFLD